MKTIPLDDLEKIAAKHPHMRVSTLVHSLKVLATAEALKRPEKTAKAFGMRKTVLKKAIEWLVPS